jgi:hypothetical protein
MEGPTWAANIITGVTEAHHASNQRSNSIGLTLLTCRLAKQSTLILASLVQTEAQCRLKVPSKLKRQSHNDQQNVAESTAVVATGIHAQTVQVTLAHFIAEVTAHGMELQVSVAKQPHSDQRLKHLSHSDQRLKHLSHSDQRPKHQSRSDQQLQHQSHSDQ